MSGARLTFLGDVMLGRRVGAETRPVDLVSALNELRGGGRLIVNLECVLDTAGAPSALAHSNFAAAEGLGAALAAAGVAAANLANNHALDFGPQALSASRERLARASIAALGSRTPDGRPAEFRTVVGGRDLSVVGCCALTLPGRVWQAGLVAAAGPDVDALIRERRAAGDFVVVFVHWGHELVTVPPPEVRRLARRFAELGAGLVVGHGPHVVQGYEEIGATPVYYSLGDAVFDRAEVPNRSWGVAVDVDADGDRVRVGHRLYEIDPRTHVPRPSSRPDLAAQLAERRAILHDDAAWRRAFADQAGSGFIGQQLRTTWRMVQRGGLRGLAEKLRGLRPRHVRLLAYAVSRRLHG
jgi:poly-gamma-glutamate synthesis protein (capsule biosynthesis protein)